MIAYLECTGGASGDMVLGGLIDAGADPAILEGSISALGLSAEVTPSIGRESRGHLRGTRVCLEIRGDRRRAVPELIDVVATAGLPDRVRERSLQALDRLAAAESRVHDRPVAELVLHELSGADTLVDLVGSFWLAESLDVDAWYASWLPMGSGSRAEGWPNPAPATLEVLAGSGAVVEPTDHRHELVTPTGAAILATLARFERPRMQLLRSGCGIGTNTAAGNGLRVWLGEPVEEAATVAMLETNIDDMTPAELGSLAESLMAEQALDVALTPIVMKKGRPGHRLSVMCADGDAQRLASLILRGSSTLGVRRTSAERIVAGRRLLEVSTVYGTVRVKLKEMEGAVTDVAPEHDDCVRAAREHSVSPRTVARSAERAAWDRLQG